MSELRQIIEQRQKLTPQQILQTVLLQLNSLDLEERITQEMEKNPVLEMKEPEKEEEQYPEKTEKQTDEEIDWDDLLRNPADYRVSFRRDKDEDQKEMPLPEELDFIDYLFSQIRLLPLTEQEKNIAEEIGWNIDERGYLTMDGETIAGRTGSPKEEVERILKIVQSLDPPGIGARDLRECLLIQLARKGKHLLAERIILNYFDDFSNHRFEKLKSALGCSEEKLNEEMEIIAHLNPKPGEGAPTSQRNYIVPDLIVEEIDGELVVSINDGNVPELQISPVYVGMLESDKNDLDSETRHFLRKKIESAKWFIQAVQQRQMTMLKVMKAIIKKQEPFFRGQTSEIRPMVLKNIAEMIGMDVSTISRVTRYKYVQTPVGIFALKFFFTEGLSKDGGDKVSTRVVKEKLKQLIETEDKASPYSDGKLRDLLRGNGYQIARRTVTKYREQLKIPMARLRREL